MSYNGSGTFQINTSGQPVVAGTVISATAFNALTADLATGLSTAITKDGQTTTTARIPFAAGISSTLTTDSSSVSTGSIITAGGIGAAKAAYIGTTLNVGGASTFTGSIAVDSVTDSSSTTTGSIQTDGGVGIAKALFVGTTANIAGVTTVQAGTASLPAITTTGDTNTGIFFPAADTIAFSKGGVEAMRIDASGRLGVATTGTSVPAAYQNTNGYIQNGRSGWAYVVDDSANTHIVHNVIYDGTNNTYAGSGYASRMSIIDADGSFRWYQAGSGTAGNTASLSERVRITSGGDLLVGTTSNLSSAYKTVIANTNGGQLDIECKSGGQFSTIQFSNNLTGKATIYFDNTNNRTYVETGGSGGVYLASGGVAWIAVSDERKKENLVPITNAITKVSSLRAVTGNYIEDSDKKSKSFLIAQDVLAVFPEAVDTTNPEQYGLAYTDTIPLLVAAIKEQQAIIESLKARLDAANL